MTRDISSDNVHKCIKGDADFIFLASNGIELLGEEELKPNFKALYFDEGPDSEEHASLE